MFSFDAFFIPLSLRSPLSARACDNRSSNLSFFNSSTDYWEPNDDPNKPLLIDDSIPHFFLFLFALSVSFNLWAIILNGLHLRTLHLFTLSILTIESLDSNIPWVSMTTSLSLLLIFQLPIPLSIRFTLLFRTNFLPHSTLEQVASLMQSSKISIS